MLALLRLAGFDLQARMHAWRRDIENKAQHKIGEAKRIAGHVAIAAVLYVIAAILAFLALLLALAAGFRAIAVSHGPGIAFAAMIAVVLVLAVMAAAAGALFMRKARSPATPPVPVIVAPAAITPAERTDARLTTRGSPDGTGTLVDLAYWALRSFNVPVTGNWLVDGLIRQFGGRTQRYARQGVTRAATAVQTGSRPAMLGVLGGIAVLGFVLTRRRR